MYKYIKIGIILTMVVVIAIFADYLATLTSPSPSPSIFEPRPVPFDRIINDFDRYYSFIGDMELFYRVNTILSTINITLLIFLIATYFGMYRKLKSEFTIGLILFSLILLFYAFTSNPLVQLLFGFQAFGLGPFAMLPGLFTTFALAMLAYLTMR